VAKNDCPLPEAQKVEETERSERKRRAIRGAATRGEEGVNVVEMGVCLHLQLFKFARKDP
jgi:hypothetical protein